MILELSGLAFMDSTGMQVLLSVRTVLNVRGGTMALVAPQPVVARILELTGADQYIPVYGSLEDAQTAESRMIQLTETGRAAAGHRLALPEVTERPVTSAPTWFVRDKKSFVTLWAQGHHREPVPAPGCAAPPGAQAELIAAEPDRIFRPPYVGGRGWIGVRLDGEPDWAEIAELCQDAYRVVAGQPAAAQMATARSGGGRLARRRYPGNEGAAIGESEAIACGLGPRDPGLGLARRSRCLGSRPRAVVVRQTAWGSSR